MNKAEALQWIEKQNPHAVELLKKWADINSWSENHEGLLKMASAIRESFAPLADDTEEFPLPLGKALKFTKNASAKHKILLGGHLDTVYPPNSPFQTCREEGNRLLGPGVADMKGGLVVLYLALAAFEKFGNNPDLGWTVLINPDEEIGSPNSRPLWKQNVEAALLFEPSFADGAIVSARKGSMNFHLAVKGVPAHAGRDFHKGKSAIKAISQFIVAAYALSEKYQDLTLNVAKLHSDSPLNVVAFEASCEINIRSFNANDLQSMHTDLKKIAPGTLTLGLAKQPKPFDQELFKSLEAFGPLTTRESGGLSDGNILAEAGIPCIDTLGVIGGNLHTPDEYMEIESMIERAKLVFLFLNRYGTYA